MPLIEIQALRQKQNIHVPDVLTSLTKSLSETLAIPAQAIRCVWQELASGCYAEGLQVADEQVNSTHPVLVKLLMFEGRSQELIERAIQTVADDLQKSLKMESKNFFISYYESKSGQLFVGGELKRNKS